MTFVADLTTIKLIKQQFNHFKNYLGVKLRSRHMITVIYDHEQSTSRLANVSANQSLEEIMMDEEVDNISKQNFKDKMDFVVDSSSAQPTNSDQIDSSRYDNEESIISVR